MSLNETTAKMLWKEISQATQVLLLKIKYFHIYLVTQNSLKCILKQQWKKTKLNTRIMGNGGVKFREMECDCML